MRVPNAIRMVLVSLMACLLSACWISDNPLITDKNASSIEFAGRYRAIDEDRNVLAIRPSGARAYVLEDGEETVPARFLKLRSNWYLVQYQGKDTEFDSGEAFYVYQTMRFSEGKLFIHAPDCADVEGPFAGLKRGKDSEICNFSKLKGLKAIALAYIDKIEKGGIAGDSAIWERVDEAL